jgi:Holliday junction DNA helicase RuvA
MIGSLRGTVLERTGDGEVLLEVAGVGYRVLVTPRVFAELEPTTTVFLYVHHHVREDAELLYGFTGRDERITFELLLKANGVGPALAMAILATHAPSALRDIVATADIASLCLVSGVGKKTAERLVIELRNRLDLPDGVVASPAAAGGVSSVAVDVREALGQLGYSAEEIREAMRELPVGGADASTMLRDALKLLGARRA